MTELKSFYTLELFISPGGGRKATTYVLGSLAEVKRAIEVEFSRSAEIDILLFYGEDVWLSTYHHCQLVSEINLLPYIKVDIPGEGIFTIDEHQVVTPAIEADYDNEDSLAMRLVDERIDKYTVIIDWSKLNIPNLVDPILQSGEVTIANDRYMGTKVTQSEIDEFLQSEDPFADCCNAICYGWNDGEAGITAEELPPECQDFVTLEAISKHVIFQ